MGIVVEVISQLESYAITKEALEVRLFFLAKYFKVVNPAILHFVKNYSSNRRICGLNG